MSMATTDKTTLVSLFHTQAEASNVMRDLHTAGVPPQSIQNLGRNNTGTSASDSTLVTLKGLDLPAKDLQILSDGLRSGGTVIIVQAEHAIADKAENVFESHAKMIDERAAQPVPQPIAAAATAFAGETVIPIVEEELTVGKRKVERGGVRVFSRTVEVPVEEQVSLREEHATIERHAVNRPISDAELDSLQSQSIEVHEMAEEAVVGKTARVVEEVHVGKETTERNQKIRDTVRKTQVEVDQVDADTLNTTKRTK